VTRGFAIVRGFVSEHPLVFLVVVAGVARILWALEGSRPASQLDDPFAYTFLATQVSNGLGYRYALGGRHTAYFPIGFPGSLGIWFWTLRALPWTIPPHAMATMFNFVPSLGIVVFTYLIARTLYGARIAFVAGLFVALWPNLIFHSAVAMSETLFLALFLAALYVLIAKPWDRVPSTARLVVAGVLLGASALVRPLTLLWLPIIAILFYVAVRSWKRALAGAGIVTVAVALVLLPWAIRNTRTFHSLVVISTNSGDDLCIGHNPHANGTYDFVPECLGTDAERADEPLHDTRNRSRAFRYAIHHPQREVALLFSKTYYTLRDDHDALSVMGPYLRTADKSHHTYRLVFALVADAWFWGMATLALLAVTQRRRDGDVRRRFLFLAAAALAIAPLVFFGSPRFKVPVEPFLAIAAAVTVDRLLSRTPSDAANGPPRTAPAYRP
jgi:4-amino-4-deoxy-L-arabinose transferase-like glycosyltransferase